ncbi:hypothetical protein RFI_29921, partial [Reticulomyxa filosa]
IEDADELCEHWNDFANGKMEDCIFSMRCLVIKRKKRTWTWYPKGANNPNFQNNLNKEDWDEHLKDLMEMVKISDEKCLIDKKGKVLKSSNDLKKVWSDRYGDKQSCSFVLNVVEKEEEKETEEDSDNEKRVKKKKTKGNTEEEDSRSEDSNKKRTKANARNLKVKTEGQTTMTATTKIKAKKCLEVTVTVIGQLETKEPVKKEKEKIK